MLRKLQLTYQPSEALRALVALSGTSASGALSAGFRAAAEAEFARHGPALERAALCAQWLEARRLAVLERARADAPVPLWLRCVKVTVDLRKLVTHGAGRGPRAERAALSCLALRAVLEQVSADGLWVPVQVRLGNARARMVDLRAALAAALARGGLALSGVSPQALRKALGPMAPVAAAAPAPTVTARVARGASPTPPVTAAAPAPPVTAPAPAPVTAPAPVQAPAPTTAPVRGAAPSRKKPGASPGEATARAHVAPTGPGPVAPTGPGPTPVAYPAPQSTERPSVAASPTPAPGPEAPKKTEGTRVRRRKAPEAPKTPRASTAGAFGGLPDDAESEDRRGGEREPRSARGLTADAEFFLEQAGLDAWPCAPDALTRARRSTLARLHPDRSHTGDASAQAFHRCIKGSEELSAALRELERQAPAPDTTAATVRAPSTDRCTASNGASSSRTATAQTPMAARPSEPPASVYHWP